MPSFKCKDVGVNCDWETTAANETELMKNITQHAMTEHKIMSIAPDGECLVSRETERSVVASLVFDLCFCFATSSLTED
jgi:predicted small metal-binding protein